jgi:hypothetical protein
LTLTEQLKTWNEKIRVLTDISLRLGKVNEDVRVSRITNEIEVLALSPITPRGTRPTDGNSQPIKLKDASELVPMFDDHRLSVYQFLRAYARARYMVPRHQEPKLVKLLMNKGGFR